jgi:hypothetical protein
VNETAVACSGRRDARGGPPGSAACPWAGFRTGCLPTRARRCSWHVAPRVRFGRRLGPHSVADAFARRDSRPAEALERAPLTRVMLRGCGGRPPRRLPFALGAAAGISGAAPSSLDDVGLPSALARRLEARIIEVDLPDFAVGARGAIQRDIGVAVRPHRDGHRRRKALPHDGRLAARRDAHQSARRPR